MSKKAKQPTKKAKQTSPEDDVLMVLKDGETGEEYAFKGRGSYWKEGGEFGGSVSITTNKADAVLFKLAQYVAIKEPGAPGVADARRILQIIYKKLATFTIGLKEDGSTFFCSWRVKEGLRKEAVDSELDEALSAEIFKAFVIGVFTPERLEEAKKPAIIERGGEGVRVGAHWGKNNFEIKKAGKEARKTTPEEMRLEFALLKLLRDYSPHRDKEHPLYLLGNGGAAYEEARVGKGNAVSIESLPAAVLEIPQAQLYVTYYGKKSDKISTPERKRVDALLMTMQRDIIKFIYTEKIKEDLVNWCEVDAAKITIGRVATLTSEEAAAREAGGDLPEAKTNLRIKFHPGYTFDIRKKYSLFPDNYLSRMERAIGGGRSSSKYWLLNQYLNGIRGQGRKETPLDFETALKILDLEAFRKKQGAPKAEAEIDEAARVAKEVGLLLSWSKEPGARGQKQWQFNLNPDFV